MSASDIATVLFRTPDSIKLILDFEARPNHYLMQRQETNTRAGVRLSPQPLASTAPTPVVPTLRVRLSRKGGAVRRV